MGFGCLHKYTCLLVLIVGLNFLVVYLVIGLMFGVFWVGFGLRLLGGLFCVFCDWLLHLALTADLF